MIHSMTAFARAEQAGDHGTLSWEIRSVNHRYLEPHLRLPDAFRDLEGAVREALRKGLSRGKVECTLRFAEDTAGRSIQLFGNVTLLCEQYQFLLEPLRVHFDTHLGAPVEDLLPLGCEHVWDLGA